MGLVFIFLILETLYHSSLSVIRFSLRSYEIGKSDFQTLLGSRVIVSGFRILISAEQSNFLRSIWKSWCRLGGIFVSKIL